MLKMFCFCRLMRHGFVCNTRARISRLQTLPSNHVSTKVISTKTSETIPDKTLSIHVIQEVNDLEFAWSKQRNGRRFKNIILEYFSKIEGSTSATVDFLRAACGKTTCHYEMICSLLDTLNEAISKSGVEFNPSPEEKIEALKSVLTFSNYYVIKHTCRIFKLNESSNVSKEFIDNLLNQQKLVEASYCIGVLDLHLEYDMEKILFPLLMDGKASVIRHCIKDIPNLQLNIAKKLDSLLIAEDKTSSAAKFCANSKKIIRVLSKWVLWFKIPVEQCPNFHYVRSIFAVNVLIKRRKEQSVSENVWEDMVMTIVGENSNLKEHLIYQLMQQNDKETALKMVKKLNMKDYDDTKLNSMENKTHLESIVDKEDLDIISTEHFETEDKSEHLMFSLTSSDIKYVDDALKFTDFIEDIMKYDVVGIDTEWKPNFGLSAERLALMQIAVRDKVYILDMISLRNCLTPEHWDNFMENILGNKNIIKLGCGIMNDINMLIEESQGTKGKKIGITHILDMSLLYNKLKEIYPDEIEDEIKENKSIGLSKLCELILGLPLNKEERLCNWEKRPLTESQLEYAALDALCLIQMYDKLKLEGAEKSMNFAHLVNLSMHLTASLWKSKKRVKGIKFEKNIQISKPIPIHMFKVVVDSALESQGKQLRQLGADVIILNASDSPETAAQISKKENRLLICKTTLLRRVEYLRPNVFHFKPFYKYGESSSISTILHKFNVQLRSKSILSRCEACNSEEGIKLSSKEINFLQESVNSQNFTTLNFEDTGNTFQRTLEELTKSGVTIKFKGEIACSPNEKPGAFLCTKCGTVQ